MRAIDARDIHAAVDQIAHKARLAGGRRRQGDHDAGASLFGFLAKQTLCVLLQALVAAPVVAPRMQQRRFAWCHAADRIQRQCNGIQRGDDMTFAAPERGQPQFRQAFLQNAQIFAAQRNVGGQVGRILNKIGRGENGLPCRKQRALTRRHLATQFGQGEL